jgi:hypothetical protein
MGAKETTKRYLGLIPTDFFPYSHNLTHLTVMVRYELQRGCYVIFIMSQMGAILR